MFKLAVFSCLVAVAFAKPGGLSLDLGLGLGLSKTLALGHHEPIVSGYRTEFLEPKLEVAPIVKTALFQEPAHIEIQEPTLTKVGEHIETIPTAVSWQRQSRVFNKAQLTEVIAPAVRTSYVPTVRHFSAPIVEKVPIVKSFEVPVAPVIKSFEAPLIKSYAAPLVKSFAAPLSYAAPARLAAGPWDSPIVRDW